MMWKFCINIVWVFFTLSLPWVHSQDGGDVPLEVITDSSPCSATCGLGMRSQTLCLLKDTKCRVRKVQCLDSWQCGLRTLTVVVGQRLHIDCVEEVMKEMGPYSWRSVHDELRTDIHSPFGAVSHFTNERTAQVCTYRCDVQDAGFRRVKRIYWGVRVLHPGVINLDMHRSVDKCERGAEVNIDSGEITLTQSVIISL
uniref:Transmembrane protein 81 n=1 Tax=Periophthalmus magnuspinnatus TaxID=409849 RepID=A0A3B4ASU1_9GOBI